MDPSVAKALEGLIVEPMIAPGGFYPIRDVKDENVVRDVKIAVEKYNEQNNQNLSFVSVVKGRKGMAAGPVYDMVIAATEGGTANPRNYQVEFWLKNWMDNVGDKGCMISSFKQIQD